MNVNNVLMNGDCATWTQCACMALERFLEASFFIPRLPRGDLEMGKD